MHNGYLYPDDVVVTVVDGKRVARIGWELPAVWTDEAKNAAKKVDFLTGWEMARQAYRDKEMGKFHKRRQIIGDFYAAHHSLLYVANRTSGVTEEVIMAWYEHTSNYHNQDGRF